MVLLIDSLDQLKNDDLARSDISFLADIKPHKDSVIIVSALPDEYNAGECLILHLQLIIIRFYFIR